MITAARGPLLALSCAALVPASALAGLALTTVDCEQAPAVCAQQGVFSVPVLRLYLDGRLALDFGRHFGDRLHFRFACDFDVGLDGHGSIPSTVLIWIANWCWRLKTRAPEVPARWPVPGRRPGLGYCTFVRATPSTPAKISHASAQVCRLAAREPRTEGIRGKVRGDTKRINIRFLRLLGASIEFPEDR